MKPGALRTEPETRSRGEPGHGCASPARELGDAPLLSAGLGITLHVAAMLLVMAIVALVVYEKVGLKLGRAWLNTDELGLCGIVLDVDDVDPRRAQAGHQEVARLDVRVRRPRAKRRGAGVPAEVVQLVADSRGASPAV